MAALIATLYKTERRLEELTGGQVDTVSGGSGQPFMLRRAQLELRVSEIAKQAAILNALPAHIALLDAQGVIVSVNETWRQPATENCLQGPRIGLGVNYPVVCESTRELDSTWAHQAADGIRVVLAGEKKFSLEYSCPSPTDQRWFLMTVTTLSGSAMGGAVVMHLDITQRRRSEDAGRVARQRLRNLIDGLGTSMMVGLMTPDGILVEANAPALTIMGLRPEDAIGHPLIDSPWITHSPTVQQQLRDAISRGLLGEPSRYDMQIRGADGRVIDIDFALNPVRDETGSIAFLVPSGNVITARKRAEMELRWKTAFLEAQVSSSIDGILVVDERGTKVLQNQRMTDLLGIPQIIAGDKDDTVQSRWVAEATRFPKPYAEKIAFLNSHPNEISRDEVELKDGTTLDRYSSPVIGVDGKYYGRIWTFRDITERRRSMEELRTSEQRFKALFDQAAVGVAQVEATTGRFVQVNQRFANIVGRSRDELEQLAFAAITHPKDIDPGSDMWQQLRTGAIIESAREKRLVRKDGTEVWVNLTVSAMWAPGEAPGLCIAVVQDITERKRLDEHYLQAQKMEALGQFSGGVAHDFNNILATISGYTELSMMLLPGNPEVRGHLASILKASGRAADLVKQILTFSRQQPQERQTLQLQPVVEESIKLLRATVPATIVFDPAVASDTPTVLANANQIHQVLMNLGINAWHAMQDRPGRLQIKLEKWAVDDIQAAAQPRLRPGLYARVSVRDTGCGMDAATLRRIFEPFFTTKPPGQGTGLGLSVVHGIMDGHDGAITVESQPGEGTVFHLWFPAHAGAAAVGAIDEGPLPRGRGETLLVVDDEELIASLLQLTLARIGYQAEFATNPATALNLVRANPSRFKLVLSDQTMPGMTGLVLATQLRKIQPDLPVILMTGFSLSLTPERLELAGVRAVLFKPIMVRQLANAVHAALSAQSAT